MEEDSNLGVFHVLPVEITVVIFSRLCLTQLAQMRCISNGFNNIISSELFANVFDGRVGGMSQVVFFAHGSRNGVGRFGELWGVRSDADAREISIPLAPILKKSVHERDHVSLLSSFGVHFLFMVELAPWDCDDDEPISLLMINILSSIAIPIPKPEELRFTRRGGNPSLQI